MNKRDTKAGNGQLPLPSPRSPRELDERILAHARANAPRRSRKQTLGWVGGLATTAVLVVAVYLTNSVDTNTGTPLPAPAMLERERTAAEPAAAPASRAAAKSQFTGDADQAGATASPLVQRRMAPAADLASNKAVDQATAQEEAATHNLEETLRMLGEMLIGGEAEQARLEYRELRNACSACGLPETLEQALQRLPEIDNTNH